MPAPLLLSVFPTFAMGGAQMRFTTLANAYGPAWRHAIVSMDGATGARARLDPGLDVAFPDVAARKGDLLGNVRRFRAALAALRPATLLTHNFGSIEWAIANRLPRVRHVHVEDGFGPEERARQIPRRVLLRRLFLRGRTVVLPSRTLLRIATEQWRLSPRRLHYVPNGVDLARFARRPRDTAEVRIATVAALRPEKNLHRLLRAFAQVPGQPRLQLIGDGPERPELERASAELGLAGRVEFLGHVAQPARLLGEMDVFALSSDTEQMPISLLEAMASGAAVVATDVGDVAAMLPEDQRAFVVPCDDAALAVALARLVDDAGLRARLGAANRARVERDFDQAAMLARWDALLRGEVGAR